MNHKTSLTITTTALFIALGVLFPVLFHAVGAGFTFLPMHIPVLLCGLLCGPIMGVICGILVPLLSSITGMPPIFPTAVAMIFELATYGLVSGICMCLLGKVKKLSRFYIVLSLLIAIVAGRLVSGLANSILYLFTANAYTFTLFLTSNFLLTWPGTLLQLIVIPILLYTMQRTHVLQNYGISMANFKRKSRSSLPTADSTPIVKATDQK